MIAYAMQLLEIRNRDETMLLAVVGDVEQLLRGFLGRHLHLPFQSAEALAMICQKLLVQRVGWSNLQSCELHVIGRNPIPPIGPFDLGIFPFLRKVTDNYPNLQTSCEIFTFLHLIIIMSKKTYAA